MSGLMLLLAAIIINFQLYISLASGHRVTINNQVTSCTRQALEYERYHHGEKKVVVNSSQLPGPTEKSEVGFKLPRLRAARRVSRWLDLMPRDDKMDDLFFDQDNSIALNGDREDENHLSQVGGGAGHGTGNSVWASLGSGPSQNDDTKVLPHSVKPDHSIEEPEMFTNNHQSSSLASFLPSPQSSSNSGSGAFTSMPTLNPITNVGTYNPRHYNSIQANSNYVNSLLMTPHSSPTNSYGRLQNQQTHHSYNQQQQKQHALSPYGKYPTNMFSNNYNLNYIHSFLTSKPMATYSTNPITTSALANSLQTMQSLLNSNPNGLTLSSHGAMSYGQHPGHHQQSLVSQQVPASSVVSATFPAAKTQHPTTSLPISINNSSVIKDNSPIDSLGPLVNHYNISTEYLPLNNTIQCGKQQVPLYREPRIVGGNSTYEGEFPWAVSIQRHGNHHCGGVIVGRRWILTAAHCVRGQLVANLMVRTGGHTLTRSSNGLNSHLEKDLPVDQIIMHDDFSRYDNLTSSQLKSSATTNNADIALIRLRQDIHWSELAWPVCFPTREAGNFSGHDAIVVGWGKLNEKSDEFSNDLQKVKLTIVDNKVCQNWFRQAGRDMPIDDRIICAGFKNGGKDACHGDSGGPLLSRMNGHYVVVGVVSTGIGCARPLLPGLYSRVSSYSGWIEQHIAN